MEQRRILLFFVLSALGIFLNSYFLQRMYGPPPGAEQAPLQQAQETEPGPDSEPAGISEAAESPPSQPPRAEAAEPPVPVPPGRDVVVENDLFRSVWTTAGARLKSLQLKKYRSTVAKDSPPLELIRPTPAHLRSVGIVLQPSRFNDTLISYDVDPSGLSIGADGEGSLVFRGKDPAGRVLEKRLNVRGGSYLIDVSVHVGRGGEADTPPPSLAVVTLTQGDDPSSHVKGGFFGRRRRSFDGALVLNGKRLEQTSLHDLENEGEIYEEGRWGGFADSYFIRVLVANEPSRIVTVKKAPGGPEIVHMAVPFEPASSEARFSLYAGPKDLDVLKATAPGLERAVDFGWFWFIAMPLLHLLKLVHVVTGNYGFDIIIVSALIKILFIPLTQKSMQNMQAMQKLQPQMTKIREKYKDDQQEMQKQVWELYKRHHVNPVSGCLPMLLQIPVFVGLYNALLSAIELRHSPFIFWVTDLSAPERLMIGGVGVPMLAVTMGASMLAQQMMTPSTGDPTQRRIMMIMPVVFTFMFINFPSGLVLYWLVNNLLTIGQQYFLVNRATGQTKGGK